MYVFMFVFKCVCVCVFTCVCVCMCACVNVYVCVGGVKNRPPESTSLLFQPQLLPDKGAHLKYSSVLNKQRIPFGLSMLQILHQTHGHGLNCVPLNIRSPKSDGVWSLIFIEVIKLK